MNIPPEKPAAAVSGKADDGVAQTDPRGGTRGGEGHAATARSLTEATTASSILWNVLSVGVEPFAMRCKVSGLTPDNLASAPVSMPVMAFAVASQLGSR